MSDLGKTLNQAKDTGELMPYLCSINVQWDRIDLSTVKKARFERADWERFSVKKGDLLVCEGGDIGRAAIWEDETPMLYQNALHRIRFNGSILPRYCLRFLQHLKQAGVLDQTYGKGVTIKHLVKSSLFSIPIPIPPVGEQEQIVVELDCLSEVITKKKQQLAELDKLAQSIFYDIFGDPIINEKGWDVKKLGDVCETITDGTHFSPKSYETGEYKYITAKNIKKDGFDFKGLTYLPKEIHKEIYSRCSPVYGDVLFIKDGATTGIAMINTIYEEFSLLSSVALLRGGKFINNRYLRDYLNFPSTYKVVRDDMGGAAITRLTLKKIARIRIVVPPLDLQTAFAAKIEFIEHQKDLIMKSIAETETLFNSRMDYWFN